MLAFYAVGGVARIGAASQGLSFFASRDLFAQMLSAGALTFYTASGVVARSKHRAGLAFCEVVE